MISEHLGANILIQKKMCIVSSGRTKPAALKATPLQPPVSGLATFLNYNRSPLRLVLEYCELGCMGGY